MLAMWTADSDYQTAPCVIEAARQAVEHGVFGYSWEYDAYKEAVAWWMRTRHNWDVNPNWVLSSQGLGNAIALCLQTWTEPGDGIVIFTPVYHEFALKIGKNGRKVVECPLKRVGDRYEVDLEDAQSRLTGNEKMILWCSPQNPSGRVWTETELKAVAAFAATIYSVYELYEKIQDTDFSELVDITKDNINELFQNSSEWFSQQAEDTTLAFSEMMREFTNWGEKDSIKQLLSNYKETIEKGENTNNAIDSFDFIKTIQNPNNQLGTNNDDTLINTLTNDKGIEIGDLIYGDKGNDTIIGNAGTDILIGGEGDDILKGNGGDDILGGNKGNDTLIGGKGNDYLEGGTGFDTYIIEGNDTIFDSDGKGEIKIDGKTINQDFELKTSTTWRNDQYTADKRGDDLIISSNEANQDRITIKDYFLTAKKEGEDYNHIGIKLKGSEDKEEKDYLTLTTDASYGASVHAQSIDKKLILQTSESNDIVFTGNNYGITAKLQAGNDYISATLVEDIIYGEKGNDIIYGSSLAYENLQANQQPKDDHDIIYGGEGTDLIHGGVGHDFIYGNKITSDLETTSSQAKGDWLMGGSGKDTIFGSASKDFLQGGKDADVIYGGANNDVILGDGNVLFGKKSITINSSSKSIHYEYHGNSEWQIFNQSSEYIRTKATFDWKIDINSKTGQYILKTKIKHTGDHSLQSDNANDYLYGGLGDDLVIGQYGDDYLEGNDGNDILWGDDNKDKSITGDDILIAGLGADTLHGGLGFDTYLFSKEDLNDSNTNTIIDKDNNGILKIDNQNWANKQWQVSKDDKNNSWTDGEGNRINKTGDGYLISSDNFTAKILIEGQLNDNGEILGIKLANPNHAPTVANQQADQIITAEENFSLALANNLFNDEDGDLLEYSLTTDNGILPEWLHFNKDNHTLSGTAPIHSKLNLTLTATDPTGDSAEQSFTLRSNARPTLNQALDEVLFLSAEDNEWQYQLPKNTFIDKDGDSLTYQITMADGSHVPTAITIDNNTGEIHVNAPQLPLNEDSNNTYDIKIIATDEHGVSVSTETQLQVTNSYIEANADNTIMGATWGKMGDDVIVASDDNEHTIYAMMGNDTLKGGAGIDKLNGGIGDDTLIGGQGDDVLNGGIGDDTYVYHKGDGKDVIRDWTGEDSLQLTDFTIDDLLVSNKDNDLLIKFKESETDSITIGNANAPIIGNLYAIEHFVLADRTLSVEELRELG